MLTPRPQQHVERLADQCLHGGVLLDRQHAELAADVLAEILDANRQAQHYGASYLNL